MHASTSRATRTSSSAAPLERFGHSRRRCNTLGVHLSAAQLEGPRDNLASDVGAPRREQDGITFRGSPADPSTHTRRGDEPERFRTVDDMEMGLRSSMDGSRGRRRTSEVIRRSFRGGGAVMVAEPCDRARVDAEQPSGTEQQRGFARPGGADDRQRLSRPQSEIDRAENADRSGTPGDSDHESFADAAKLERERHAPSYAQPPIGASPNGRTSHQNPATRFA